MGTTSHTENNTGSAFEAVVGLVVLVVLIGIAVSAFIYRGDIWRIVKEANLGALAVVTQPEGATILLDGIVVGKSPMTVKTSAGAHTVTARLEGHRTASEAINLEYDRYEGRNAARKLVRKAAPWVINLSLKNDSAETATRHKVLAAEIDLPAKDIIGKNDLDRLDQRIKEISLLVSADPDKAISVALLQGRVDLMAREVGDLREQVNDLRETKFALVTLVVTLLLGFAGLVLALWISRRNAP